MVGTIVVRLRLTAKIAQSLTKKTNSYLRSIKELELNKNLEIVLGKHSDMSTELWERMIKFCKLNKIEIIPHI